MLYVVCFGKGMKDSFFKGTDCYKKNRSSRKTLDNYWAEMFCHMKILSNGKTIFICFVMILKIYVLKEALWILHYLTIISIQFCYEHFYILLMYLSKKPMTNFCTAVYVLNHIRGKFWTCQGPSGVNKISQICVVYKRSHGRTINGPPALYSPAYRLSFEHAFSNTEIDFAELFMLKIFLVIQRRNV